MRRLNLIPDGRDVDRLVDVMGQEIRVVALPAGGVRLELPMLGEELDSFTQEEWDSVLSEGKEYPLDTAAGTIYTVINW